MRLNQTSPTTVTFHVDIVGVSIKQINAFFRISLDGYDVMVPCVVADDGKCTCLVPVLGIKKGSYNASVFVTTSTGLFFNPMKLKVEIADIAVTASIGDNKVDDMEVDKLSTKDDKSSTKEKKDITGILKADKKDAKKDGVKKDGVKKDDETHPMHEEVAIVKETKDITKILQGIKGVDGNDIIKPPRIDIATINRPNKLVL